MIIILLLVIICIITQMSALKTTIFGATGGVGQLVAKKLLDSSNNSKNKLNNVIAVTRNIENAKKFELLQGCSFKMADAREKNNDLIECLIDTDNIVVSLGTTAFPTSKWEGGKNNPQIANVDTMNNIMSSLTSLKEKKKNIPKRMILVSSIGVERSNEMPFKILNSYGVLDSKLQQEKIFLEGCENLNIQGIVIRPGRLVGEPFTNFDLAKLFGIDQGKNQGICVDKRDNLSGDVERADIATAIVCVINARYCVNRGVFSIINTPGPPPSEQQWSSLLDMFISDDVECFEKLYKRESSSI